VPGRPVAPPMHPAASRTLLIAALAWASIASAQTPPAAPVPLGTVTQVEGLVTMSLGSQVATVQPGTPIFDGARFVSSSSGQLQLSMPGCAVNLRPNQLVQIDGSMSCSQQISMIQTLPAAGGLSNSLFAARTGLPLLGSAAVAAAVARVPEAEITPRPR
jgi:hypothetical protein